ncbi:uncharacterized protein [Haliotis asinina]|uniref:uncharacterized protein n=1 Tax=Haliotis asinina TaxID=109174 RepID=UPI003532010F
MVHEHVLVVLLCVSAAFGAPLNQNYFRCHLDLCKRGEQYCVEERQRCYHCADSAHLCNTTELTRDCDSYCYRVQLQALVELEANKSAELADRQADLQYEQQKNADLKQTLKDLTSSISRLTNLNKNLNADVTKGENLKTEHKEVVKQLKQSRNNFFIVCTVTGTLGFIVILLAGALCCLYCRDKGHSRLIDITQQGEIKEAKGSDLVPLMDRSNNCPGFTINGDFTVSRLEVQSPDKTIDNDINSTPPPVYQSRIEAKEDIIDITVTDKNDINQRENERTPSVLKNIQPTDSYSGNKDPTDPLNQILITDNRG